MKLRCVRDYDDVTTGWFNKITRQVKVPGISYGKVYDGTPVNYTGGSGNIGFGNISTSHYFMIFNDNKEWEMYDLYHFEPA